MANKPKQGLRDHLISKYREIESEMLEIYQYQQMWRDLMKFTLEERNKFATERSRQFAEMTISRIDKLKELSDQIENLTTEQEKHNDLIYSIADVANCVVKDLPMDMHSFHGFMILLTANIGELQGRIENLPDSIEWKKDALEKLEHLLGGNHETEQS